MLMFPTCSLGISSWQWWRTSLILVFIFLPYTLLLLLGYKLYSLSGRKHFNWITKMKPLLDSYYAPYKPHTRYWTGFLLLVRCVLYIVFSFNPLGGTHKSLLAIVITFSAIGLSSGYLFSGKLYTKLHTSLIETSIYLNLIVLSAITLAGLNSAPLVHSLVGIVFATTMGIILYYFHITYASRSALCLKVGAKISSQARKFYGFCVNPPAPPSPGPARIPAVLSSHDPHRIVTKTVIDLREPSLEKWFGYVQLDQFNVTIMNATHGCTWFQKISSHRTTPIFVIILAS